MKYCNRLMPIRFSSTASSKQAYPVKHEFRPQMDFESPMYKFQKSLPSLPVPPLEETCERYWKSVQPLFKSEEDRINTRKAIDSFISGPGPTLHQRLIERKSEVRTTHALPAGPYTMQMAKSGKSWLIDWWNDAAYFSYRDPVVINVSYFFHFVDNVHRPSQTSRAAGIIRYAMEFRDIQTKQLLEADSAGRGEKAHGLCMDQYQYMFNSCRVPREGSDFVNTFDPEQNGHISVIRKGKIFAFDAVHKDGTLLSEAELVAQLEAVKELADVDGFSPCPIGAITSTDRDTWTRARRELWQYTTGNREALTKLESSVLTICLDDTSPLTREEVGRELWHSDGRNRWFDKTLLFVVFENGKAGLLGEHSMMDATPTTRLCNFILEGNAKNGPSEFYDAAKLSKPEMLLLQAPPHFETYVQTAINRLQNDGWRHDHHVLAFRGYGKSTIKKLGVSPDSFVQLSIQMAYYKLFGENRATYESSQTKKYATGRTEVCRSVTQESADFNQISDDSMVHIVKKGEMARKAIGAHTSFMKLAVDGRGVDRVLFGYKKLVGSDEPMPEIFKDPMYSYSSCWYISTSQIGSELFDGWGWGEVVPDGVGVAYMIKNDSIHYNIAALKGGPGWDHGPGSWKGKGTGLVNPTSKMAACLEKSLLQLKEYLEATPPEVKSKL